MTDAQKYPPCVPPPTQKEIEADDYYDHASAYGMTLDDWEQLPIDERVRLARKVNRRDQEYTQVYMRFLRAVREGATPEPQLPEMISLTRD